MNTKKLISAALVSLAAFAMTGCGNNKESFLQVNDKKVQYTHYGTIEARISGISTTPDTPIDSLGKSYSGALTKDVKKAFLKEVKDAYKKPYYMVQVNSYLKLDKEKIELIDTENYTKYPVVQFDKKFLDTLKTYSPTDEFVAWLAAKSSMTMDPTNYKELESINKEMNCFDKEVIPELIKASKANANSACKGSYCSIKWNASLLSEVAIKNPFTKHVLSRLPEDETYSSDYRFESAIKAIIQEDEGACNFSSLVIDLGLNPHAAAFVRMGHKNYSSERILTEEMNDAIVEAINTTFNTYEDIPTL